MREDAWFAGFTDGEGCFKMDTDFAPVFSINLRADDYAVLEQLWKVFGGSLSMKRCIDPARRNKPQFEWHVSGKVELRGLVEYFDRFPLRAKKARDFAIWRRAVHIYCGSGRRHPELPLLRQALMEGRAFLQSEMPVSPQLKLILGDESSTLPPAGESASITGGNALGQ